MKSKYCRSTRVLGGLLSVTMTVSIAHAQGNWKIESANPNIRGDGTMGAAAAASMARGYLLMNDTDAAAKRAATRAAQEEAASGQATPRFGLSAEEGGSAAAQAPVIVGGHSFAGQNASNSAPSDSTGAIGRFSYIQTVNTSVRIYNRNTHAVIATGTLNQLAGNAASVNSFDPQILWDPTTNRFYYAMDSVFSDSDNKVAFGFSKTANPTTISNADWCHYLFTAPDPARFLDYPKLGDSRYYIIIGANAFQPSFMGADIFAVAKPPGGTTCPSSASLKSNAVFDIRAPGNLQIFTPVPSNQVDDNGVGHVVARNSTLPSTKLWFIKVAKGVGGVPMFGNPRGLTVPSYTIPPSATQPTFTQVLDTLDGRPTQAMQAINPDRSNIHSFWVQHTIKHATENRSIVRWYEIDPAPAAPVLLRSGAIGKTSPNTFFFNAAIAPDRRKQGATEQFGDSFVIGYNTSSAVNNLNPRVVAASSFNGGAIKFLNIRNGVAPYRDFSCPAGGDECRWGDYSSAMPDPRPTSTGRGTVWGTNQYSGLANPPTDTANFRTWIFAVQP